MKSAIHLFRFVLGLDFPDSQVSAAELELLLDSVRSARNVVELGSFEGRTAVALAQRAPQARVFAVDPFPSGRLGIPYAKWIVLLHARRQRVQNLELIRALSHEAAPHFGEEIDLLFIDADHSYESVARDWADWTPKVRPGGLVAMHDSRLAPNSPVELGSMRFFREAVQGDHQFDEVAAVDSLVILRKADPD